MEANPKSVIIDIIGLSAQKAEETLRNQALTAKLLSVANSAKSFPQFSPSTSSGKLLYSIATSVPESIDTFKPFLIEQVAINNIKSAPQLEAAIEYLKKNKKVEQEEFLRFCGVGVEVTTEQIQATVNEILDNDAETIRKLGWENKGLVGNLIGKVKQVHKWGNPNTIKELVEAKLLTILGPKVEGEAQKAKKKEKVTLVEETKKEKLSTCIGRELKSAVNTEEQMKKHLAFTGGKVMTRFPPEPNGYLHIGHAKAMRFSFTMAAENGGHCYLRFDDTNPEKETGEFIENIKRNVAWLGYTPWKITHASEYFPEMYELALELIRRDKAYVDEQPWALIKEQRFNQIDSPYRNTSPEVNLEKFDKMKRGYYAEGEACLRMKIDMKHPNPCMRDPVAYRIKYLPHPHVGDKWCVYPTYDMEHCIVDSIENITHSLCTLEFEIRRDSYYWLVEALDLYKASVWEYSRLNITHVMMSKRKLQALVEGKLVKGWDDPRLPTLNGLKRRGYTSEAINEFVDLVGVTRRGNENIISIKLLEHCIRKDLNERAPRTLAVIEPLSVTIAGLTSPQTISVPRFPQNPEKGSYTVTITSNIFIERSDFHEADDPSFFGLAPGKIVGLKYLPFKIRCVRFEKDNRTGVVSRLDCEVVNDETKPKGVLHWISYEDSVPCEVRLYDYLFLSENPAAIEDWKSDLNPNSLQSIEGALINKDLLDAQHEDKFQFERVGYFSVDYDSTNEKKVFNRVVTLLEGKKKPKA
ncbi:unnamed protein product [Blepharisma stoltei]|uniref:glutamine--tRNA ligase n=1 Tax=Blepharisma stoltei TaxID=1481888 RepID=A0AAU9JS36_9CILI|nr:unnamed protein product [Blepharisma stoltei]